MNELNHEFTLVLLSQVYPGFTGKLKKKCQYFYQVETLILGKLAMC